MAGQNVSSKAIEPPILLVAAGLVIWQGADLTIVYRGTVGAWEAGGWLVLLGTLLVLLTVVYWIQQYRRGSDADVRWDPGPRLRVVVSVFAMLLVYIFAMGYAGYLASTVLFFVAFLRVFGSYRWGPTLIGSIAMGAGSAYLWASLGMMLPSGFLPWP